MESYLSKTIRNTSYASKMYDNVIKELFADKQVLANILKYTLDEFMDMSIPDIIAEMDNPVISTVEVDPGCTNTSDPGKIEKTSEEDNVIGEGKIVYDIRFSVYHGDDKIKILMNLEAQNLSKPGNLGYDLDNRIIYYLCRMISAQKEVEFKHSEYNKIKAVRSIWICLDGNDNEDSINRIELTTKNIFGKEIKLNNLNKMQAVIITLRARQNIETSKHRLIAMLEELISKDEPEVKKKILAEKYDLVMSDDSGNGVKKMCNFSEALIEEGLERGLAQGREQGLAQGREQGLAQGREQGIEQGREREEIRGLIKNISNMQGYDLNAEQIMKFLSLDEETYLELSNLIHSHEDFTLDELVDEYFNSTNDTDEENESESENNII